MIDPELLAIVLMLLERAGADALACPVLPSRDALATGNPGCRRSSS